MKRTVLIALAIIIALCVAVPITATVLRPPAPTEAELVGTWSAGEASVTLRENGTALLEQVPAADGVTSGVGSWTLSENSSEGWIVLLNQGDLTLRLYVDQKFPRTSLDFLTCDPDEPGCALVFERAPAHVGANQ